VRRGERRRRLEALEAAVAGLSAGVVTRAVTVVDAEGRERIRVAVHRGVAEVSVRLPGDQPDAEVVLYAAPGADGAAAAVGVQVRAGGDGLAELDAVEVDGRWRATYRGPA
jgi:hypothetical protein